MQYHWNSGAARYATIGLELALSALFGLFVGRWLDRRWGTDWISMVGLGLGVAAGYRSLWLTMKKANRELAETEKAEALARKKYLDGPPSPRNQS